MGSPLYPNGVVFSGHKPEPDEAATVEQLVQTTTAEQPIPVQMASVNTAPLEPVQQQADYMRT